MPHRRPVRRLLAVLTASAAGGAAVLVAGPASAAGGEVAGTVFPDSSANFAAVSCDSATAAGGAGVAAKVREIGGTRFGSRSTGFTGTGSGVGAGPKASVRSVGALTSLSVDAWSDEQAAGVAYVWLFPTDAAGDLTDVAWLGRTPVSSDAGFARQDVAGAEFTWEPRDPRDFSALDGGTRTGTIAEATRPRWASGLGDGPGHVGFAYGCDGADFSLDGFRLGTATSGATYDFEGLDVVTTMRSSQLADGPRATLVGRSTSAGEDTGEPLVLQRRTPGSGPYRLATGLDITVDAAGVHRTTVRPARATEFRWVRSEVPYAEGGTSNSYVVAGRSKGGRVLDPAPQPRPDRARGGRDSEPTAPAAPGEPTPALPEPTQPTQPEPTSPAPSGPTQPSEPQPSDPTSPGAPTGPSAPVEPTAPTPTAPDPTAVDPDAAAVASCEVALATVVDAQTLAVLTDDELAAITDGEDATAGTADDCTWTVEDDWLTEQGLRESAG